MASWAEASREAMFKRVEGGFLFGAGGFAHQYLVTEAKKAEIQRLMWHPTPKRILLFVLPVLLILGMSLLVVTTLCGYCDSPNRGLSVGRLVFGVHQQYPLVRLIVLLTFLSFLICGCVFRVFGIINARPVHKRITSVLEGARHTEQQITWRDPIETYARMLPMSALFGAAGASALLFILFLFLELDAPSGMSAPLVVLFLYLAILKLRLERLPER
jgi:hypothetical protein